MNDSNARLPLEDIRVLDLGLMIAVPFAARWLGCMGADVIQIESSHNLINNRWFPPFADEEPGPNRSAMYNVLNTSKRSISLNMRTPQGRHIFSRLVKVSDIVMDNYSTGLMERWGFGYGELRKLKPDIIMLSLGAFGRTGPMKDYSGLHSVVNLFSGLADVTGYPGGHPRILGSYYPDVTGATYATLAILSALRQRARTGQGQYIEVSMSECLTAHVAEAILDLTLNGRHPQRMGNHHPHRAPHSVYRCRGDDQWVAISVTTDDEWEALCRVAGHPEWLSDPRFADPLSRKRNEEALDAAIQEWTRQHDKHHVATTLQRAGVPAAPSMDPKEVLEDRHLNERGSISYVDHPETGPRGVGAVPWKISDMAPPRYLHAPLLFQGTPGIVLELLGMEKREMDELVEAGVLE